jgi:hypothetical protein
MHSYILMIKSQGNIRHPTRNVDRGVGRVSLWEVCGLALAGSEYNTVECFWKQRNKY